MIVESQQLARKESDSAADGLATAVLIFLPLSEARCICSSFCLVTLAFT